LRRALLMYPGQSELFLSALRAVSHDIPDAFPALEGMVVRSIKGEKP
jgi:hypothetical protein